MGAVCLLLAALSCGVAVARCATQEYYIAAEQVLWDYAPTGLHVCTGEPLSGPQTALWTTDGVGSQYIKARYIQYADPDFTIHVERPADEDHLGILGPLIRVTVGDTLRVVFRNRLTFPANFVTEGLVLQHAGSTSFLVQPNDTAVLTWQVPTSLIASHNINSSSASSSASAMSTSTSAVSSSTANSTSSTSFIPHDGVATSHLLVYQSTVTANQRHAGLVGPILVTDREGADPVTSAPADVDREFVTLFQVFDEQDSPFLEDNLAAAGIACYQPPPVQHVMHGTKRLLEHDGGQDEMHVESVCFKGLGNVAVEDAAQQYFMNKNGAFEWEVILLEDLEEGNKKHAINGYLYCNLPGLNASVGDRVRWHTAAIGNEVDVHTPHWHGLVFSQNGRRADEVLLLPGSTSTIDGTMDNPGEWYFHCHVNDHLMAGMTALVYVDGVPPSDEQLGVTGRTRTYYIAAEMVDWDYVPEGVNLCSGTPEPFTEEQNVFVAPGEDRFGSVYRKARYIQYTDDTFSMRKLRGDAEQHLGLLGPTLYAEVGDMVEIHFLNLLPIPATMHVHGAWYDKASEGMPYNDGTCCEDKIDDNVPQGGRHVYVWKVGDRAAPGTAEPPSKLWMYHGHFDEQGDTYAGLVGGLVVSARGNADADGRPLDVDREYVMLFQVFNEQLSSLFSINMGAKFGIEAANKTAELVDDPDFQESNLMHAINGYMYCNLPGMIASPNERVRLYVMGLGTEVDLHAPSVRTATFNLTATTQQALSLLPGVMKTADVLTGPPGTWQVQCNTFDHITAGMLAILTVEDVNNATMDNETIQPARTFYIAAEEIEWDYAPLGPGACGDLWAQQPGDRDADSDDYPVFLDRTNTTLGSKYIKAAYRAYTDASFATRQQRPSTEGLLGPTLYAAVGETIQVVFLNRLTFDVNLVMSGGLIPLNEDALEAADAVAPVLPSQSVTYQWLIPASAHGTSAGGSSWGAFTYGSTVDIVAHSYAGLNGLLAVSALPLVSTPPAVSASGVSGTASYVPDIPDIPLVMMIVNENASPYNAQNIAAAGLTEEDVEEEGQQKHTLNGYLYCSMPPINLTLHGTTRWLLASIGSELDLHSPVFTQQLLLDEGRAVPTVELLPAVTKVVTVQATTPGRWEVRCHVQDHLLAGMRATITVQ